MTKSTDKSLIEDTEISPEDLAEDLVEDEDGADIDDDDPDADTIAAADDDEDDESNNGETFV